MTAKRIIWILVLIVAGYVVYQYVTKGEVEVLDQVREKVTDKGERTPDEEKLDDLEKEFLEIKQRYEETALEENELIAMRSRADEIGVELKKIRGHLTRKSDQTTVGRLLIEIRKFKDQVLTS